MKDGQLVETGTHSELMNKKGEYYALYELQAKAFADSNATDNTGSGQDANDVQGQAEAINS